MKCARPAIGVLVLVSMGMPARAQMTSLDGDVRFRHDLYAWDVYAGGSSGYGISSRTLAEGMNEDNVEDYTDARIASASYRCGYLVDLFPNEIYVDIDTGVYVDVLSGHDGGYARADGQTTHTIRFTLDRPHIVRLSGSLLVSQESPSLARVRLLESASEVIFNATLDWLQGEFLGIDHQMALPSGRYRLIVTTHPGEVSADPGQFRSAGASVEMRLKTSCLVDLNFDGQLDVFDFLAFQSLFDAGDVLADFDGDGDLSIFDFLAFSNAFEDGCD